LIRLIIVRHGETEGNRRMIMQGQRHGRLSQNGKEQVKKLGVRLKDEKISIIYSSDLRRAVHTTREISKFHSAPVHHVKALREMRLGVYEGKSWKLFSEHIKSKKIRSKFRPRGGESYVDVRRRLKRFTSGLYKKYPNGTVVLSTHGIAIRCLMSIYLGTPIEKATQYHTRNAGILILDVRKSKVRVILDDITAREQIA
jgi:phosphoserine phosphatase